MKKITCLNCRSEKIDEQTESNPDAIVMYYEASLSSQSLSGIFR